MTYSIGHQYGQGVNLLFIADCQLQLQNTAAAIDALQQSADLAGAIGYEPLQEYALNRIAELQQPIPVSKRPFSLRFLQLQAWHYMGLGLAAFLLVLIIRWLSQR